MDGKSTAMLTPIFPRIFVTKLWAFLTFGFVLGSDIPIEERSGEEIKKQNQIQIAPQGIDK